MVYLFFNYLNSEVTILYTHTMHSCNAIIYLFLCVLFSMTFQTTYVPTDLSQISHVRSELRLQTRPCVIFRHSSGRVERGLQTLH